jgi:hypothetical protein
MLYIKYLDEFLIDWFLVVCTVQCKVDRVLVLRKCTPEPLICELEELENEV